MKTPKKILIIKNDKIGDMIFASGVFREIKKYLPSAVIDVVASPENKSIIEENKNINKIYSLRSSPRTLKEFYNYFLTSKLIKKENYDVGIDMRGNVFNPFFLLFLPRVKYKTGFHFNFLSKLFLNLSFKRDLTKHENLMMLTLINKTLKINAKDYWPDIEVGKEDIKNVDEFLKKNKLKQNKYICIVPEASVQRRQWPLKHFITVIKFLKKTYPQYKLLLVGKDTENIRGVLKKCPYCISVFDKNLREVHLIFKKSKLCFVIDGGANHLAWSTGTRVLSIMSKFLVRHVRPLGTNVIALAGGTDTALAKNLGRLPVKEVENNLKKMLSKKGFKAELKYLD